MNKNIFKYVRINNRGNISILVIFVLIASSLIGILTTNYIKDLMQYNNIVYGYYKSYYLSKAGLEISLAEISNNGVGFENIINTGDSVISGNFTCKNCSFYSSILGSSNYFSKSILTDSGCSLPISLNTGESFILPLFKQINNGTNYQKLTNYPTYQNMANKIPNIQLDNISTNKEITIGIFIMSGEDILQDGVFIKTGSTNNPNIIANFLIEFETYATNILLGNYNLGYAYKDSSLGLKSFLLLGNSTDNQESISFCINIKPTIGIPDHITLPTSTFYIKSIGNNQEKTIGLEAFLKQPIPDFLIHTYLGTN